MGKLIDSFIVLGTNKFPKSADDRKKKGICKFLFIDIFHRIPQESWRGDKKMAQDLQIRDLKLQNAFFLNRDTTIFRWDTAF